MLRYYLNHQNSEDYKRGLLILFYPFIDEMQDIHNQDVHILFEEHKDELIRVENIFEKHKVMTDIIESIQKEYEKMPDDCFSAFCFSSFVFLFGD